LNGVPAFLISVFDREGKYYWQPVRRGEAKMLVEDSMTYLEQKYPEAKEKAEASGEFLFWKYLLVLGGKIRKGPAPAPKKGGEHGGKA
jgi:hypothetical protein